MNKSSRPSSTTPPIESCGDSLQFRKCLRFPNERSKWACRTNCREPFSLIKYPIIITKNSNQSNHPNNTCTLSKKDSLKWFNILLLSSWQPTPTPHRRNWVPWKSCHWPESTPQLTECSLRSVWLTDSIFHLLSLYCRLSVTLPTCTPPESCLNSTLTTNSCLKTSWTLRVKGTKSSITSINLLT